MRQIARNRAPSAQLLDLTRHQSKRQRAIELALRADVATRQFGSFAMAAMMPGAISKEAFVTEIKQRLEDVDAAHLQALFIGFAVLA